MSLILEILDDITTCFADVFDWCSSNILTLVLYNHYLLSNIFEFASQAYTSSSDILIFVLSLPWHLLCGIYKSCTVCLYAAWPLAEFGWYFLSNGFSYAFYVFGGVFSIATDILKAFLVQLQLAIKKFAPPLYSVVTNTLYEVLLVAYKLVVIIVGLMYWLILSYGIELLLIFSFVVLIVVTFRYLCKRGYKLLHLPRVFLNGRNAPTLMTLDESEASSDNESNTQENPGVSSSSEDIEDENSEPEDDEYNNSREVTPSRSYQNPGAANLAATKVTVRSRLPVSDKDRSKRLESLSRSELRDVLEKERDKQLCVVCQDRQRSVLVMPCKHLCLCNVCSQEFIQNSLNHSKQVCPLCPLCRTRIQSLLNVFT